MCAAVKAVVRELAQPRDDFTLHPYPITPMHGDYLYHADLAAAAKAQLAEGDAPLGALRVKASHSFARNQPAWSAAGADWDIEVAEVDAAGLVAAATFAVNGWLSPPWLKDRLVPRRASVGRCDQRSRAPAKGRFPRAAARGR